jgi:hypothetical protein
MKPDYRKLACAIVLSAYYLWYAAGSGPTHGYEHWNIIDNVDLVIHEAGHWIFIFFGEFIRILGGSLMQVLMPSIFAAYFFLRLQFFSGGVVLFWIAQNIVNVSVYMGDSISQTLPLLGGDGTIHDWNYLLSHTGLLAYTDTLARITYGIGMMVFLAAAIICIKYSFAYKVEQ